MALLFSERFLRRALIVIALVGLILGFIAWTAGRHDLAEWCWVGGTVPVVVGLLISIVCDVLAGRMGVDSIALVSMSGALVLGEALAGIVVAIMYAGGNVLEDIAVARAEHDLRLLIDRAPRIVHRRDGSIITDTPIEQVAVDDAILVRGGEVVPIDGVVTTHERDDESQVYPRVARYLADRHGLGAMSRAHREIIHLSRLLRRLADGLAPEDIDPYLIRDAQRVIESIEALVRIHNAQEEDIYEYAIGA